ncbi:MAG: hypothetical protein JWN61_791 [Pseudonocardiales bacterium]|nr:hypothetical protein [Pseudonocardiales bacterium]
MLHPMQFSLFGAESIAPSLDDLAGVLFAGGHWVRRGDAQQPTGRQSAASRRAANAASPARLSVIVDDAWRQAALVAELAARGFVGEAVEEDGRLAARTGFEPALAAMAERWIRGASIAPPADLTLTAGGLRLWAICAGREDEAGYLLPTAAPDDPVHRVGGAQLARLGLAGVSLGDRGGPGWRITGAKRRHRLAEIVGAPPPGSGSDWPRG